VPGRNDANIRHPLADIQLPLSPRGNWPTPADYDYSIIFGNFPTGLDNYTGN
jgi:hypothetical protein